MELGGHGHVPNNIDEALWIQREREQASDDQQYCKDLIRSLASKCDKRELTPMEALIEFALRLGYLPIIGGFRI
jgi:hypothetical protein